ncbi:hypothetical protein BASA81_001530 [Batrachochytrium salamandrivorans]|nr:hypothetical protein BASA81_001530 [Batrachochytrium salamandrivorans]
MKFLWLLLLCAWASPAALQSKELGELVQQLRKAILSRDVEVVKTSLANMEAFGDKLVCPTCPPASKKSKASSSSSSSSSLSSSSSAAQELERLRMIALFDECTEDLRHAKLVLDSSKRHQDKEVEKLRQVQSGVAQLMDSLRVTQGDLMKAQLETSEREQELYLIHQQAVTAAKIERDIAEIQQHARVNYETGELEIGSAGLAGRSEDASGLLFEELTKKTRHLPIDAAVMHANPALLLDFVILLAASALGGALARAAAGKLLPIPHVVGFLIAGALVGPNGLSLVTAVIEVDTLAQFGSVFFMLGLGLEFSLKEQLRFRAMSMGGTLLFTAMIAVTIQLCTLVFSGVVESPLEGLLLGMSVSLSSLSIVLDYLRLHKLLQSTPAKVMIGILGFQGFLVGIFFSIPLALTSRQQEEGAETTSTDAFASICASVLCAVFTAMFAFGTAQYVLPRLLVPAMAVDMYLLCVVAISMLMALLTVSLGLSLDLGAFFAGLMLSEVDAGSNRTKELVLPLSSVFGSLLFASLGMMLNLEFFWKNLGEICFIAAQLVVIKLCMVGAVTKLFDFSFRTAIFCAVGLCHVGELSLLFSSKLQAYGLLSRRAYLLFLAATCVTLTSAPLVMRILANARVADMINRMDNVSSGNNQNLSSGSEEPPLAVEAASVSDPTNGSHHGDFTSATWRRKL